MKTLFLLQLFCVFLWTPALSAGKDSDVCTFARECIAAGKINFDSVRGDAVPGREDQTFEGSIAFQDFPGREIIYWGNGSIRYVAYKLFPPDAYKEAYEKLTMMSGDMNNCGYGDGKQNHYQEGVDLSTNWYDFSQVDVNKKTCYYTITTSITKEASGSIKLAIIVVKTMT
jgi:hypothetical protein